MGKVCAWIRRTNLTPERVKQDKDYNNKNNKIEFLHLDSFKQQALKKIPEIRKIISFNTQHLQYL